MLDIIKARLGERTSWDGVTIIGVSLLVIVAAPIVKLLAWPDDPQSLSIMRAGYWSPGPLIHMIGFSVAILGRAEDWQRGGCMPVERVLSCRLPKLAELWNEDPRGSS